MKIKPSNRRETANALVITMLLTATALLTLAGVLSWTQTDARLSARSAQYGSSLLAAEAATQKAMGHLWYDFQNGGEAVVLLNLTNYMTNVPNTSDSAYWGNWQFSDGQGNIGNTFIQRQSASNLVQLSGTYSGMFGYVSTYEFISDATQITNLQSVTGANMQQVQLTRIPIFQFLLYSSENLEVGCTQPFGVGGLVHANGSLYTEPDSVLVYDEGVTVVSNVVYGREPQDSRAAPSGISAFLAGYTTGVTPLTLPVGTNNSPAAIQQIIQPPPTGESATSALGRSRYYNQVDMVITVMPTNVSVTSGYFNNFQTAIPTNQIALFVATNASFYDQRESKTIRPIDINVGALTTWSHTNTLLRTALGGRDLSSVYVWDQRTFAAGSMSAVRLTNGMQLPTLGLTVATALPLYVKGVYNQPVSNNFAAVTNTLPASLVADAITELSDAWVDTNSNQTLSNRLASLNGILIAALLSGAVYTTNNHYSGGMENFIRLLEDWSNSSLWYNGSLIKMFPSAYATNYWPGPGYVYNYPGNNHYYWNLSYGTSTGIPPLTPSLDTIALSQWLTLSANTTNLAQPTY